MKDEMEWMDQHEPEIPRKSTLHSLAPIGIGTPECECLTSYIARVARSHCVTTGTLITRVVSHAVHKKEIRTDGKYLSVKRCGLGLNGIRTAAKEWAAGTELLTGRKDLHDLTLLKWGDILPSLNLLATEKRWCPACYQDIQDDDPYDALLWSVKVVTVCAKHSSRLISCCPHCGRRLPILGWKSNPGFCDKCSGWLGLTADKNPTIPDSDLWCSKMVGAMIAAAPDIRYKPQPDRIPRALSCLLCARGMKPTGGQLGILTNASRDAADNWLHKALRIPLQSVLAVSAAFGISPLEFLTLEDDRLAAVVPSPREPVCVYRVPRNRVARIETQHVLEEALADTNSRPVSFTQLCKRHGISPCTAYFEFPSAAKSLSARYTAFCRKERAMKLESVYQEMEDIVRNIRQQNMPLTIASVVTRLPKSGIARCPEVLKKLSQIIHAQITK